MNSLSVVSADSAYTKPQSEIGLSAGVVIYAEAPWDWGNTYFRYSALLERKKFRMIFDNVDREFDHLVVGASAALMYNFEMIWPFVGVSTGLTGKDACEPSVAGCRENEFDPILYGTQLGFGFGPAHGFKVELVIENQLAEVDARFEKYRTVSVLLHIYPDEN